MRNRLVVVTIVVAGSAVLGFTQESPTSSVFTAAQAAAGRTAYESVCFNCHQASLAGRRGEPGELPPVASLPQDMQKAIKNAGGKVPPLAGPDFLARWAERTTADLSKRVKVASPFLKAVTPPLAEDLDENAYLNLTAFILQANGARAGAQELTETTAVPLRAVAPGVSSRPALSARDLEVSSAVGTYCSGCHDGRMRSPSGILLDQLDATQISTNREVWSRAYRQLQAGTMPPVGAPRPNRATSDAVLVSIEEALGASAGRLQAANSLAVANRLATLLWNGEPDASLLDAAQRHRLSDPVTLQLQIHRMLADDRAQAFVSNFFVPWLELDKLSKSDPDKKFFPDYDVSLRDSLAKETELFVLGQLRDDRDPVELWTADSTFLNEQLANHYGIPNVSGSQFRRVSLSSPERQGLLGQGSILMVTSRHQHGVDAAYTTPATRAKWVRLHFLGAPLPRPFPGAQPVKPELPITPQTRVLPAEPCTNCHRNFFPLGYALENFDPLGRWRTYDQVGPVDASGTFVDGTSTNGVVELRRVLLQRPEAFRTTITEKLLVYSSTGSVPASSGSTETLIRARQILRSMQNASWSAVIAAVVQAEPLATK